MKQVAIEGLFSLYTSILVNYRILISSSAWQAFEADDYRAARFEMVPRKTNERWAINLIKEVPPKGVKARVVACDGGPGALGHPRVYINLVSAPTSGRSEV